MFLDKDTRMEVKYDEVVISRGNKSISLSHKALTTILEESALLRKKMISKQIDYETWLEAAYERSER